MDDRYSIDTPEHISFDYDVAGIGSRFLAAIVDTILLGVMLNVISVASTFLAGAALPEGSAGLASVLIGLLALLNFLLFWGYFMFFELAWNGQSPGKRLIGVRVVREGGLPITTSAAAIRNLVRIVDFLPFLYGIGVITMFIDQRSRRLGDLAAGTLVVKDRHSVTLESLAAAVPPPFSTTTAALTLPNIHMISSTDYDLVQEFLRRRSTLSPEVRARLGSQLAARMRTRLDLPPDGRDEHLLQQVAIEYPLSRRSGEATQG